MRNITQFLAITALFAVMRPANASPTGLIVIPTADTREPGTYEVEWQNDGRSGLPVQADTTFLNTQFGLLNRLEAGVDLTLSAKPETDVFFNYKYAFSVRGVRVGVGTFNIGQHSKPVHYVVSGTRVGKQRLHVGAQRTGGDTQLLLGAHREAGRLLLLADYTSGAGNFASAGFEFAFSDRWSVQWGALFPNNDGDTQYTLHLIYNNRFRRERGSCTATSTCKRTLTAQS